MAYRQITVVGGNLFQIAGQYLGDATQAVRIAALNGLDDFFLSGTTTLLLPQIDATQAGGVPQGAGTAQIGGFLQGRGTPLLDEDDAFLADSSGSVLTTG